MELPPDGDPAIFALLYGNREELDRIGAKVAALEQDGTAMKIDTSRSLGQLEQGDRHLHALVENLLDRVRGTEQGQSAQATKNEDLQARLGKLDRELHGEMVRLQTIGAAIGAFLTIAQALQYISTHPIN